MIVELASELQPDNQSRIGVWIVVRHISIFHFDLEEKTPSKKEENLCRGHNWGNRVLSEIIPRQRIEPGWYSRWCLILPGFFGGNRFQLFQLCPFLCRLRPTSAEVCGNSCLPIGTEIWKFGNNQEYPRSWIFKVKFKSQCWNACMKWVPAFDLGYVQSFLV